MKNKKDLSKLVKVGSRKFNVYKDYERNEITVIEGKNEVFHGPSGSYHRFIRKIKNEIAKARTTSI